MAVIKRDRKASAGELVKAIEEFVVLLRDQGEEEEAIRDLNRSAAVLGTASPDSDDAKQAAKAVINAFEGDHELNAYTFTRDNKGEWSDADKLAIVSARVLNLAKRLR